MAVQGNSFDDMVRKLEITAREAEANGCTWSISQFTAGRERNIISGYEVILDPSGKTLLKIGPDPRRIEKLIQMKPPKNLKDVRAFLGLITQLGRFCPNYAMTKTKIRSLLN